MIILREVKIEFNLKESFKVCYALCQVRYFLKHYKYVVET